MLGFEAVSSVRAHAHWLKTFNGQANKHILDNPPLSFRPSIFFTDYLKANCSWVRGQVRFLEMHIHQTLYGELKAFIMHHISENMLTF